MLITVQISICVPLFTLCFLRKFVSPDPNPCTEFEDKSRNEVCKCHTGCEGINRTNGDMINAIFNKETKISSRRTCSGHKYCEEFSPESCAAANGRAHQSSSSKQNQLHLMNCIHTDRRDRAAYWYADMGRHYTVTQVFLSQHTAQETWNSLRRLNILIDAQLCYSFSRFVSSFPHLPEIGQQGSTFEALCQQPWRRGQIIRLQKAKLPESMNTGVGLITLCEVMIYVCPLNSRASDRKTILQTEGLKGKCISCPENCTFVCDNVYGCLSTLDDRVAYNLAVQRKGYSITYFAISEKPWFPKKKAADGVPFRETFCYQSLAKGSRPHVWRVHFDLLSIVMWVNITLFAGDETTLRDVKTRVGRVINPTEIDNFEHAGDEACTDWQGAVNRSWKSGECHGCPSDCPVGSYFSVSSPVTVLKLCEVEVFGHQVHDLSLGDVCNQTCGYKICKKPLKCEDSKCKSPLGGHCLSNDDCLQSSSMCENGLCKLELNAACGEYRRHCGQLMTCATNTASNSAKCKARIGGFCTNDEDCASHKTETVKCDYLLQCRIAVGGSCPSNKECVAGAVCDNSVCTCQETSIMANSICQPPTDAYGSNCSANGDCTAVENSVCRERPTDLATSGQFCLCEEGHSVTSNFTCKANAGRSCSSSQSCSPGLVCESGNCSISHGGSCAGNTGYCTVNDTCDELYHRCRCQAGNGCQSDADCVYTTKCQKFVCKIVGGVECSSELCEAGYYCSIAFTNITKTVCVKRHGGGCDKYSEDMQCSVYADCSRSARETHICTRKLQRFCHSDGINLCGYQRECSKEDKKCTLLPGAKCVHDNDCGSRRVCDVDRKCRISKGERCDGFELYCRLRSVCDSGVCVCAPGVTSDDDECTAKENTTGTILRLLGTECVPQASGEGDRCQARNAVCKLTENSGVCICSEGYSPHLGIWCLPAAGSFCEENIEGLANSEEITDNEETLQTVKKKRLMACAAGSVCDHTGVCKLDVNQLCLDDARGLCKLGTTCDITNRCKISFRRSCKGHHHSCQDGTKCDAIDKCKSYVTPLPPRDLDGDGTLDPAPNDKTESMVDLDGDDSLDFDLNNDGVPDRLVDWNADGFHDRDLNGDKYPDTTPSCRKDTDCQAGSRCGEAGHCVCNSEVAELNDKGFCMLKMRVVGGPCISQCNDTEATCQAFDDGEDQRCVCNEGFEVDETTLTCKVADGRRCIAEAECVTGKACDNEKCKNKIGETCDHDLEVPCGTGAVCDEDGICRVVIGGHCEQGVDDVCKLGTYCDNLSQCKTGVGFLCNLTAPPPGQDPQFQPCVGGAQCVDFMCSCNLNVSDSLGIFCKPKAGFLGGACKRGVCDANGTECNKTTNQCQCQESLLVNSSDLTCFSVPNNVYYGANGKTVLMTPLVVGLLVASFFIIALLIFIGLRLKKTRERLARIQGEMELQVENLEQITKKNLSSSYNKQMRKQILSKDTQGKDLKSIIKTHFDGTQPSTSAAADFITASTLSLHPSAEELSASTSSNVDTGFLETDS